MKYSFIILVFLLIGCQDIKKPERPDNLIAKDDMVSIYVDAYLSNSARSLDNRSILDKGVKLDSFIYNKYDIDSTQFAKSNAYYTIDLNEYGELFREVEKRLVQIQEQTNTATKLEEREEQKGQDSLSKEPVQRLVSPQVSEELDSIE